MTKPPTHKEKHNARQNTRKLARLFHGIGDRDNLYNTYEHTIKKSIADGTHQTNALEGEHSRPKITYQCIKHRFSVKFENNPPNQ